MDSRLQRKYDDMLAQLRAMEHVAVAFSGGVDSVLLLVAAHEALGDDAFAITAASDFFPERESDKAIDFCKDHGIRQELVRFDCLEVEGVSDNPPDRCYRCKLALMGKMDEVARKMDSRLVEGSNASDALVHRPGALALRELGIASPLADAGITKAEVRDISRELGLSEWNKPSLACLATRFPYGQPITQEELFAVDAAEQALLDEGFTQVRVRVHGDVARIELLSEEMPIVFEGDRARRIYDAFRDLGFAYSAVDLLGYRMGSADEVLEAHA